MCHISYMSSSHEWHWSSYVTLNKKAVLLRVRQFSLQLPSSFRQHTRENTPWPELPLQYLSALWHKPYTSSRAHPHEGTHTHTQQQFRRWEEVICLILWFDQIHLTSRPPTDSLPQLQAAQFRFSLSSMKCPYSSPVVACRSACPLDI